MRDFIDNLIDRHIDAAPRIKPRLLSVFEPYTPQSVIELASHGDNGTDDKQKELVRPSTGSEEVAASRTETITPSPSTDRARPSGPSKAGESERQHLAAELLQPHPTQVSVVMVNEEHGHSGPLPREERRATLPGAKAQAPDERKGPTEAVPPEPLASGKQDGLMRPRLTTPLERDKDLSAGGAPSHARQFEEPATNGQLRSRHQAERADHNPVRGKTTPDVRSSSRTPSSSNATVISPTSRPDRTVKRLREAHQAGQNEHSEASPESTLETRSRDRPTGALVTPVIPSAKTRARSVSPPEPVINVTIGRVEVRATVAPQKQAPKPERRSPVMGLEEYLSRRSQGRER